MPFITGARIDHAHHAGVAYKALTDTLAFEKAIETAVNMVNVQETLVIVTGDHAHDMGIVGYQHRGNPIFGRFRFSGHEWVELGGGIQTV